MDLTPRLRLLFLLPFAPRAGATHGGARVTGQLIARLALHHEVAVLYLADDSEPPPDPELVERCAIVEAVPRPAGPATMRTRARFKLRLLRGFPTWASELASPRFRRRVSELAAEWRPDVVQLEFPVMGQYLPALASSDASRVLVDLDASLRDLRDWEGPLGRLVAALDERAWRRFERRVIDGVQAVVVFTERDRRALEGLGATTPVLEIPFGVPLPEAALSPAGTPPPSVLFVGNFRHNANVDAAVWLGRTLFPPVQAALPDARLTIVGASPTAEVLALAGDSVSVAGRVPEVAPYMDQAAVVAAPIRDGGGMRVKVLEALAAGKAVVATPLAVEGLGVTSGKQLEIAASGEEFSYALERLLRDESRRRELGNEARAWAREHLGWDEAIARYDRLYGELTGLLTEESSRRRSVLELLLPRGRAARALVLGSACPERLRPAAGDAGEPLDLVVVAPDESERRRAWLDRAIDECSTRLDPDGIAYLILPRRARRRAARRLRARGLAIEAAVLHRPDLASSRELVPLQRVAFTEVVGSAPWKRRVVGGLFRVGAGAALRATSPNAALVARRPGARRQIAWLDQAGSAARGAGSAVISSSWRVEASTAVLHPLTKRNVAPVVAKVDLAGPGPAAREGDRLDRLGPAARGAGAAVPDPIASVDLEGVPVLVESRVEGEIAAVRLMRRPALLPDLLEGVCGWLERWEAATARRHQVSLDQLERELLAPAEELAPMLADGAGYVAELRERCARLAGTHVPFAASHNDLTMWNVLVDDESGIGIVDWEAAEEATLPMKDFFYAAVDAVAATRGYRDRPRAARDCLGPGGERAALVAGLQSRIMTAVGVDPELSVISLHACWLGHALNEHHAARPSDGRPFLQIVEWLAATLPP